MFLRHLILEPIFEVEFHDNSYGFRKNRSVHHATGQCIELIQQGYDYIIEGDVKACFAKIAHEAILRTVREKIADKKLITLIKRGLEAGVNEKGKYQPTTEGTPQGGIISPILSNIVLNKLDWFLAEKGQQKDRAVDIRFVRYADDWCVFLKNGNREYAEQLKEEIDTFLKDTANLELAKEKTLVTKASAGLNFLGFHIIRRKGKVAINVSDEKLSELFGNVKKITGNPMIGNDLDSIIKRINQVSSGWHVHYSHADNYWEIAEKLDRYIAESLAPFMPSRRRRKTLAQGQDRGKTNRSNDCLLEGYGLKKLTGREPHRKTSVPKPYQPGK